MQKFGGLVLALFCVLSLCSCAKAVPEQQVEEEREEHAIGEVVAQEQAAPTMEERLAAQLRTMTIEEKIAQMMIIQYPSETMDDTPASLSKEIITDLLKTEMGYEGLVITDALSMRALTNQYSHEEICIKAVEAGVDLLLLPNDCERAVELIKETFSEERIDQSVAKILRLKYTQLEKYSLLDSTYLGSDEHRAVVARVYE